MKRCAVRLALVLVLSCAGAAGSEEGEETPLAPGGKLLDQVPVRDRPEVWVDPEHGLAVLMGCAKDGSYVRVVVGRQSWLVQRLLVTDGPADGALTGTLSVGKGHEVRLARSGQTLSLRSGGLTYSLRAWAPVAPEGR